MILKEISLWEGDISQVFILNIFFPFFTHFLQFSYEMGENYLIVVILSKKRKISGPKQHEDEHVFCFVLILRAMQLF